MRVDSERKVLAGRAQAARANRRPWTWGGEFLLVAALGLILLALIALDGEGLPAALALLRLLLGLAFVLFVPGYALQAALFPRSKALDGPERLALAFGLSVAVVPLMALLLDRLPWGIRLWPIAAIEGLFIGACSAAALGRRRRLPPDERFAPAVQVDVRGWWAAQNRTSRILYGILSGALLVAAVSAAAILLLPSPAERLTEFYVLGPEGLAENYPRQAVVGEPVMVTAGITNREGQDVEYRIAAWADETEIGGAGPFNLTDGEMWEGPLTYALAEAGEDQRVDIVLYRDGSSEPYRRLRLWIDVVEAEEGTLRGHGTRGVATGMSGCCYRTGDACSECVERGHNRARTGAYPGGGSSGSTTRVGSLRRGQPSRPARALDSTLRTGLSGRGCAVPALS